MLIYIAIFIVFTFVLVTRNASSDVSAPMATEIPAIETEVVEEYSPPLWQSIASDIASNCSYDIVKYNCWDYSTDLVKALKKNGYDARIAMGLYSKVLIDGIMVESIPHTWVVLTTDDETVWIESTAGIVIDNDMRPFYLFGYHAMPKYNALKECIKGG